MVRIPIPFRKKSKFDQATEFVEGAINFGGSVINRLPSKRERILRFLKVAIPATITGFIAAPKVRKRMRIRMNRMSTSS